MMNINDKQDLITDTISTMLFFSYEVLALAKEKQTNVESAVYVDESGNDVAVSIYDFITIKFTSADTFDTLAEKYLENANYGPLIAFYNKVQNEHELKAGTKIKIPVLIKKSSNQNNKIYATPDMQENYGIDIRIDNNTEDFATKNGDLDIICGKENLSQALATRLTTAMKNRIRLGSYGIQNMIGDSLALNGFLTTAIEQTVNADPRIDRVNDMTMKGSGDILRVSVEYTDINADKNRYEGDL